MTAPARGTSAAESSKIGIHDVEPVAQTVDASVQYHRAKGPYELIFMNLARVVLEDAVLSGGNFSVARDQDAVVVFGTSLYLESCPIQMILVNMDVCCGAARRRHACD